MKMFLLGVLVGWISVSYVSASRNTNLVRPPFVGFKEVVVAVFTPDSTEGKSYTYDNCRQVVDIVNAKLKSDGRIDHDWWTCN